MIAEKINAKVSTPLPCDSGTAAVGGHGSYTATSTGAYAGRWTARPSTMNAPL
jgi:hypothetical protein